MESVQLSSGLVDYEDSGGDGPVLVFAGGLLMDATLWHGVVAALVPNHRCVVVVLPLGGHRQPMAADADLSLHALADLLAEFIEVLDLDQVTLVGADWGGPQLTAARHPERLAGLVLLPQEAFDNIPPGLPGFFAALACRLPGGLFGVAQALRLSFMWRVPMTFGWMAKRPIPKDVRTSWITGLRTERGVRRDVAKYVRTSDMNGFEQAAVGLAAFERPTLIVWATHDKVMPPEHGRRLADIIPDSTLVELDDGYTLLALDCPHEVATHLAAFVARLPDPDADGR